MGLSLPTQGMILSLDGQIQPAGVDAEGCRRIRAFRKMQRLCLLDLAERAECSESLLSQIETGRVLPSLGTLHRLSRTLRVNVAVLLDDPEDQVLTV